MCEAHLSPLSSHPLKIPLKEIQTLPRKKSFLTKRHFFQNGWVTLAKFNMVMTTLQIWSGNYQIIYMSPPGPRAHSLVIILDCSHQEHSYECTWAPPWSNYQSVFILIPPIYFLNISVLEKKFNCESPLPFLCCQPPPTPNGTYKCSLSGSLDFSPSLAIWSPNMGSASSFKPKGPISNMQGRLQQLFLWGKPRTLCCLPFPIYGRKRMSNKPGDDSHCLPQPHFP